MTTGPGLTIGHCTTVVGTCLLILAFFTFQSYTQWAAVVYRVTLFATVVTYALSVKQKLKGAPVTVYAVLPLDSFQFGSLALLWLLTRRNFVKLLPYLGISALQAADFASAKLGMAEKFQPILDKNADRAAKMISYMTLGMFLPLIVDVITVRTGSFVALLSYIFFYRIRLAFSPLARSAVNDLMDLIDKRVAKSSPKVQNYWKKLKWTIENYETHQLDGVPKKRDDDVPLTATGAKITEVRDSKQRAPKDDGVDKKHFLMDKED